MSTRANDLIVKYLYDELSSKEKKEFEAQLKVDPELRESVHLLSSIVGQVDEIGEHLSPDDSTINKILDFSKNYKPKKPPKKSDS